MLTPIAHRLRRPARPSDAMNKAAPVTPAASLTMVVFALSCFGLLLFLWLSFGGPIPLKPKGYRVQVDVPRGDAARPRGRRARRRRVGRQGAQARTLDPHGNRTLATIELERQFAPLRSDARAILRQKTLLGETYVELTPGHGDSRRSPRAARLPNGQVKNDRPARRDLRLARPADARGVPGLAAGAGEGHQGPRARLQRRARHAAGLRRRRRRRARRCSTSQQGAVQPARQEHRRRRSAR